MKVTVTDSIRYIGADDKDIDLFESQYVVPEGVSYNSYVILDEKIAVMDTVDKRKTGEWLDNLKNELAGKKPDYLVVLHVEPDHAGSVKAAVDEYPEMTVVGNTKTFTYLSQFFGEDVIKNKMEVKEGESLSLGSHSLTFVMAPMVHWPEVMVAYESSEKVLFSADGFGKFGALEFETEDWACEARRYYFNIVGKYGAQVQALLKKAAGLDISVICPLHGPVLKDNLSYYLGLYDTWSSYKPENKGVLVAYASIHGNTGEAAKKFGQMLTDMGEEKVVVSDLSREDMAEVIEDAFRYDRMVVAAASYDAGVFPVMQDFLNHLLAKAYQNRTVGIIENGTWAPSAGRTMKAMLEGMKNVTILDKMVSIKSTLKESDMGAMEELAKAVVEAGK